MSTKWAPHNYQSKAVSFLLSNPRSALFLDPGLGKTSISLACMKVFKYASLSKGTLLVAPLQVSYSVWPSEIEKWTNFNKLTHTILHDDNKDSIWGEQKDIYIINPEGLVWLHQELLNGLKAGKKCPFTTLFIDEVTKFKNHDSKRFGYIVDMLPLFKRRHIMTGTPTPKGLLDLWSQIYILDEGKSLGYNFNEFRKTYFYTEDWDKYNWKIKDFSDSIIHKAIAPLVLEMAATDYLDMPELIFNNIPVILNDGVMKKYKKMEEELFVELDGSEVSADAAAQASMKCHQMANGNVYEDIPEGLDEDEIRTFKRSRKTLFLHSAKIDALANLISELNGKPLLISYYFKHDLEALRGFLGDDVPHMGSGVTPKQSKALETRWNAGELPVLLGHPNSMAHGINLQKGGNDVCWFSLTWNLEDYMQLNARIYRQGVKGKQVRIHHLVSQNTLDEAILFRLAERGEVQSDLRQALKQYRFNLI